MNNIYVIYGENSFKINEEINNIIKTNNIENIVKYDMQYTTIEEIIIEVNMISLFNEKKIVICENALFLTSSKEEKKDFEPLLNYMKQSNKENIIVFTIDNPKLDERKKIVKELKNKSQLIECKKLTFEDGFKYIKTKFFEENYSISDDLIKYILYRTNNNSYNIYNEINKLMLYKIEDKTINKEDIDELVYKQIDEDIFKLIDYLISNDKNKVFEIYNELILKNEEPIKIIVMLANQFRLIYQIKQLIKNNLKENEMALKLSVHPYRIKLAKEKSYKFSETQLKNYLNDLADLDLQIKTNRIDKYLALELFMLKI